MNQYFLWLDRLFFCIVIANLVYHIQSGNVTGYHVGWLLVATIMVIGSEYMYRKKV